MNATQHESQTGTWNGWTEPVHEHDPMDDAAACPICGFSPRYGHKHDDGICYIIMSCGCHPDLETAPRYRLAQAVGEWNEIVGSYIENMENRKAIYRWNIGGKITARWFIDAARIARKRGLKLTAIDNLNTAAAQRNMARREA